MCPVQTTMALIAHSSSEWTVSCLLANLKGQGNKTKSQQQGQAYQGDQLKTSDVRFELLKPFLWPDVLFFQEICFKTNLNTCVELQNYHKFYNNTKAGILLKSAKLSHCILVNSFPFFTENVTELPDVHTHFMQQLERMCILHATPVGSSFSSVVLISYHGPKNADHCKLYTNLLKAWNFIRKQLGAKYMIIGGDFNYPVNYFMEKLKQPCSDEKLTVYYPQNTTVLREKKTTKLAKQKEKIHYFIVSTGLVNSLQPVALKFSGYIPENTNFKYYFDHSPILAAFTGRDEQAMAQQVMVQLAMSLQVTAQRAMNQQVMAQIAMAHLEMGNQAMAQQVMVQLAASQKVTAQQAMNHQVMAQIAMDHLEMGNQAMAQQVMVQLTMSQKVMVKQAMDQQVMAHQAMAQIAMGKQAMAHQVIAQLVMSQLAMSQLAMTQLAMSQKVMVQLAMDQLAMGNETMAHQVMVQLAMSLQTMAQLAMSQQVMVQKPMVQQVMVPLPFA